eukprot:gene17894-biopygen6869
MARACPVPPGGKVPLRLRSPAKLSPQQRARAPVWRFNRPMLGIRVPYTKTANSQLRELHSTRPSHTPPLPLTIVRKRHPRARHPATPVGKEGRRRACDARNRSTFSHPGRCGPP